MSPQTMVRYVLNASSWRLGLLIAVTGAAGALAQSPTFVVGGVVTGADDRPLGSASIEVLGTRWRTTSDANGRFALTLSEGEWRLRVTRIGYRPDTSVVALRDTAPTILAIRLAAAPLALSGITVDATGAPPMSRSVTTQTVRQVPPLAEPDVFRAVAFLPVVSQPNDLKGRIHLAGGASDETGVALDGHPLQDPLHLLGVLGAFNVAALERADVLIHHIPVSAGGRLSGLIDLQSRRPTERTEGEVVTSLLSSSLTVNANRIPLGFDILVSGRVTYIDKFLLLLAPDARFGGDEVPLYGYHDGVLRLGRSFGGGWRAEATGFATRDVLGVSPRGRDEGDRPLSWGETLAGIRMVRAGPRWGAALRASLNRSTVRMDSSAENKGFVDTRREWAAAGAEATRRGAHWQATAGTALDRREHADAWRTGRAQDIFTPNSPDSFSGATARAEKAVFAAAEYGLPQANAVTVGIRATSVSSDWHLAPRAMAALMVRGQRVEFALERRHQFFAELEEPVEGSVKPPMFLLDEPRVSDVAAVASERSSFRFPRHGTGSVRAEAFLKRYAARTLLRDAELADSFPDFERIDGSSAGAAVSFRATWPGGTLAQGSYTYQRARELIEGQWYPTAWDAPHDLSTFVSLPTVGRWSLTAAYRGHTGRAITPVEARLFVPDAELGTSLRGKFLMARHNSARVPPYHRIDVGTRREWRARGADWTLFAQVLNLLNRKNPIDFNWESFVPAEGGGSRPVVSRGGLVILPSLGIEVRW